MAFKGGVVLGTVSFNATGTGTTNIGATSNSGTISLGNTSSGAVAINCGTAGITVGTTANAHATTIGSTNSTSSTTLQSGSGALAVTSTNGTLTINSGTGVLSISNDASATTVNIATGGAVKTLTLGSTNTTSATAIRSGSGGTALVGYTGIVTANNTSPITVSTVTQFGTVVASTSNTVTSIAPSATSGVPFISQGAAANPAFGTAVVAGGGTGVTSFTAYAPISGGTTTTGALQSASTGLGTSGLPFLSNGSAALPSFQQLSASNVLGLTTGGAPAAGVIGQNIQATGTVASLTNATAATVATILLSAGVWDVSGMADFATGGVVTGTSFRLGINNVTNTMPGSGGINQLSTPTAPTAASDSGLTVCPQRVSVAGNTNYFLVAQANFTVGTVSIQGIITATRVG